MAQKLYEEENIRAIAKAIRSGFQSSTSTYTTAQMPAGIIAMYNEGVSRGYDEGYADGKSEGGDDTLKAYIPIIIQDGAIEITASNYDNLIAYSVSDFEYATVGNTIYNWTDEITVSASYKPTSITVTAENRNPNLYVTVCVNANIEKTSSTTHYYIYVVVPPLSSNSKTKTFSRNLGTLSYTTQYLKYSINGN
jgi:hypothetical protein